MNFQKWELFTGSPGMLLGALSAKTNPLDVCLRKKLYKEWKDKFFETQEITLPENKQLRNLCSLYSKRFLTLYTTATVLKTGMHAGAKISINRPNHVTGRTS